MRNYVKCMQKSWFASLITSFSLCIALLCCLIFLIDKIRVVYFPEYIVFNSFFNHEKQVSCSGRYIYIHDLPSRFNTDILKDCKPLAWPWYDMCPYVTNMGLGRHVTNTTGILQGNDWYATNQFTLEIIFHNRMMQYECLTNQSSSATAFYVPFYAGLDFGRYLYGYNTSIRDSIPNDFLSWLMGQPEWNYMNGNDHFFVVGRMANDFQRGTYNLSGWGNNLMRSPQAQNMTMLSIEWCTWCKYNTNLAIPYPSFFHPSSYHEMYKWQTKMSKAKRRYLYSFNGNTRPDSIRNDIIKQCLSSKGHCKWLDCLQNNCDDPVNVIAVFQTSTFCLQPPGDTPTRRSTFDSILAGCIPVFFNKDSAYTQYLWYLPKNYTKYSVFISENDVKDGKVNIEETLQNISKNEILAMRNEVLKLIPRITYAHPQSKLKNFEDAFDIAIKGVIDKVENIRREKNSKL